MNNQIKKSEEKTNEMKDELQELEEEKNNALRNIESRTKKGMIACIFLVLLSIGLIVFCVTYYPNDNKSSNTTNTIVNKTNTKANKENKENNSNSSDNSNTSKDSNNSESSNKINHKQKIINQKIIVQQKIHQIKIIKKMKEVPGLKKKTEKPRHGSIQL